jgi:hypothetical protein
MSLVTVLFNAYNIAKQKNDQISMVEIAKIMVEKNIHTLKDQK